MYFSNGPPTSNQRIVNIMILGWGPSFFLTDAGARVGSGTPILCWWACVHSGSAFLVGLLSAYIQMPKSEPTLSHILLYLFILKHIKNMGRDLGTVCFIFSVYNGGNIENHLKSQIGIDKQMRYIYSLAFCVVIKTALWKINIKN